MQILSQGDEKEAINNVKEVRDDLHALMDDLSALAKERKDI
jgi:hypothetical protein